MSELKLTCDSCSSEVPSEEIERSVCRQCRARAAMVPDVKEFIRLHNKREAYLKKKAPVSNCEAQMERARQRAIKIAMNRGFHTEAEVVELVGQVMTSLIAVPAIETPAPKSVTQRPLIDKAY